MYSYLLQVESEEVGSFSGNAELLYRSCQNTVPIALEGVSIFFLKDRSNQTLACAHRIDDEIRPNVIKMRPWKHHRSGRALR